jgi:hypothetical protein
MSPRMNGDGIVLVRLSLLGVRLPNQGSVKGFSNIFFFCSFKFHPADVTLSDVSMPKLGRAWTADLLALKNSVGKLLGLLQVVLSLQPSIELAIAVKPFFSTVAVLGFASVENGDSMPCTHTALWLTCRDAFLNRNMQIFSTEAKSVGINPKFRFAMTRTTAGRSSSVRPSKSLGLVWVTLSWNRTCRTSILRE